MKMHPYTIVYQGNPVVSVFELGKLKHLRHSPHFDEALKRLVKEPSSVLALCNIANGPFLSNADLVNAAKKFLHQHAAVKSEDFLSFLFTSTLVYQSEEFWRNFMETENLHYDTFEAILKTTAENLWTAYTRKARPDTINFEGRITALASKLSHEAEGIFENIAKKVTSNFIGIYKVFESFSTKEIFLNFIIRSLAFCELNVEEWIKFSLTLPEDLIDSISKTEIHIRTLNFNCSFPTKLIEDCKKKFRIDTSKVKVDLLVVSSCYGPNVVNEYFDIASSTFNFKNTSYLKLHLTFLNRNDELDVKLQKFTGKVFINAYWLNLQTLSTLNCFLALSESEHIEINFEISHHCGLDLSKAERLDCSKVKVVEFQTVQNFEMFEFLLQNMQNVPEIRLLTLLTLEAVKKVVKLIPNIERFHCTLSRKLQLQQIFALFSNSKSLTHLSISRLGFQKNLEPLTPIQNLIEIYIPDTERLSLRTLSNLLMLLDRSHIAVNVKSDYFFKNPIDFSPELIERFDLFDQKKRLKLVKAIIE